MNRVYTAFKAVLFSNIFYGICVVALCIESCLQLHILLPPMPFFVLICSATIFYYTIAYQFSNKASSLQNERSVWYHKYAKTIVITQFVQIVVIVISGLLLLQKIKISVHNIPNSNYFLVAIFPLVGVLYYGSIISNGKFFSLRNYGLIKPFFIAFVWVGMVSIYPVLVSNWCNGLPYSFSLFKLLLCIKNLMFLTVLCILFDIKDYASDYNTQLKTIVVYLGLRKTIYYIILPLVLLGLASFWVYTGFKHVTWIIIAINTIPFVLLLAIAYSLNKRKSILYYLAIIDGLLLVKATCGIAAAIITK